MKAKVQYFCGCEATRDLDGRVALDRSDIQEAKANNGILVRNCECHDCEKEALIRYVNILDRQELLALITKGLEKHLTVHRVVLGAWLIDNPKR